MGSNMKKVINWIKSLFIEKEVLSTDVNLDPSFYLKERNYHEQNIMDINDEISRLEEERQHHEYFMNIADTMYSKLIQKVN